MKYQISNIKYQYFGKLSIDPEQSRMDQIDKLNIKYSSIFDFLYVFLIFNFLFLILTPQGVLADELKSTNYHLEWTNLNMTSGKKSSSGYTITDTVGQTGAGKYTSTGYIVLAGFQYFYSIIPFRFSLSKISVNFGTLTPQTPVVDPDPIVLTVSSGGAGGYQVTAIEDDQLRVSPTTYIPDTTCDPADPCDETDASPWTQNTAYGFGYNMTGTDIPATFEGSTYYRPFPSETDGEQSAIVMSDTKVGRSNQSTITLKVNISNVQEAGQYQNIIKFVATPTY